MNPKRLEKRLQGKVTTIYRIQNKEHLGPYRNIDICYGLLDSHNKALGRKSHPTPFEDIGKHPTQTEKCGFLSMHYLLRWFTPEQIQELEKHGYHIVPVKGIVTGVGNHQILFEEVA